MTSPKKEKIPLTTYIEIGPNLKTVLLSMVNKVYTASASATYYKMAFEPIYHIIKRLITQKEEEEGEMYDT